jgi:excisionase family DNA binding protein
MSDEKDLLSVLDERVRRIALEVFAEQRQKETAALPNDDQALRVKDAAKVLAMSEWQIYDLVRRGELKSYRVGKRGLRIRRGAIRVFQQSINPQQNSAE